MDKIDLIVAVLGIISAVIGLLTAIIQLQHVSPPRGPQESQDNRSYINIRKWLKRAFMLFGIPFVALLIYREWDSVKQMGLSIKGFVEKAIVYKTRLETIAPKELEIPGRVPGAYRIKIIAKNYSFFLQRTRKWKRKRYEETV